MRAYTRPLILSGLGGSLAYAQALERVAFTREAGTGYNEAWLQGLIHAHPALLPVEQIEPALVPLVPICREMPVPSGRVDNLLMTEDGGIVLVEAKLFRNPEGRREVVGQILDYAKDLAGFDYDRLQAAVLATRPQMSAARPMPKPPEIVAQEGERFLVELSEETGCVVDLDAKRVFPPMNIASLYTRGGWDNEVTASEAVLAEVRKFLATTVPQIDERISPLYRLVCPTGDPEDEPAFVDAVSRNLRLGRFLILVVGDGIKEGAEQLTGFLQRHIGLHFTLGLVELSFWTQPSTGMVLVQPRILARTVQIERAVIRLEGAGTAGAMITPASLETPRPSGTRPTTLTEEAFFETLEQQAPGTVGPLKAFLERLVPLGVSASVARELNLYWDSGAGDSLSLGQISRRGELQTDYAQRAAVSKGREDLVATYQRDLAALVPGAVVRETASKAGWYVRAPGDRPYPSITTLLTKAEGWERATADYVSALARAFGEASER